MPKTRRPQEKAVDKAIDAAQHSIQLNDKSVTRIAAADLYGKKISLGQRHVRRPRFAQGQRGKCQGYGAR